MSKSAKLYLGAGLALIAFPLILSLWSSGSALMAILLIGLGAYAVATCFLFASFWHRFHYGNWPIELSEDPTRGRRYPTAFESRDEEEWSTPPGPEAEEDEPPYKLSPALQGWLRRSST